MHSSEPKVRALVVGDDHDIVHTLAELLRLHGNEVVTATCGEQALDLAARVRSQVAIVDLHMDGMSGYLFAMRLRRTRYGQRMALAALSGFAEPKDKQRALMAGFDTHFAQPARPQDLLAFIAQRCGLDAREQLLA